MAKIELLSVPIAGEFLTLDRDVRGAPGRRRPRLDARGPLGRARGARRRDVHGGDAGQPFGYPGPDARGGGDGRDPGGRPGRPLRAVHVRAGASRTAGPLVSPGASRSPDLPRNGKGYKEGAALVEEEVVRLWRVAAQAIADGFPAELPDGSRRARASASNDIYDDPELPNWPGDEWAEGPLGRCTRLRAPLPSDLDSKTFTGNSPDPHTGGGSLTACTTDA